MFPHGGRGTETTVLLRFNNAKHKEVIGYLKVGLGSPCPVLQHPRYVLQRPKYVPSWRTWRGDHRPTERGLHIVQDGVLRTPSKIQT